MTVQRPLYLDYHSTTPCDPAALEAMLPYFGPEKFGNPGAKAHAHGRRAAAELEAAKARIAALVGATAESLTVTSGATESNNLALLGTAAAAAEAKTGRNEILVGALEHDCVRKTFEHLGKKGFAVITVPATSEGFITAAAVKERVSDKTLLVSVMAANHEIGTVQPVAEIAKVAHDAGALFHSDAAQAAGKIPLDVAAMDIDMLSFCSHKIYGPSGIGALYVRQKPPVAIDSVFHGGSQQSLRPGTVPLALAVGFGAACDIAREKMEEQARHLSARAELLLKTLEEAGAGHAVNGALSPRLPGSLNLRFEGVMAEDLMLDLAEELCMSTGAACASAAKKPSPVLKAIGLSDEQIAGSVRISLGRKTTEEDVIFAARTLADAAKRLRKSAAA
ncbi:MAG: aminotransferase class V-fold PLP-dependent enzyme [Alphaproteobacteria bacterium]|nr:aminotransferase class V-fold PLP-dependent enzyme [Alphaproteobacteria bacterium]